MPSSSTAENLTQMAEFIAAVERRAFRMAYIAIGDEKSALRAVAATMIAMVRNHADSPSHEWGPLFHRTLAVQIRRHALRHKVVSALLGPLLRAIGKPPVESAMNVSPAVHDLDRALAALPEMQRQAFMLRVVEGFDAAQTAKAMACDDRQAKLDFSHAVIELRKQTGDVAL